MHVMSFGMIQIMGRPVGGVGGHENFHPTTRGICGGVTLEVTGGLEHVFAVDLEAEETTINAS